MNRLLLVFIFLLGIAVNAYAANIQSISDGDWTNPAIWDSSPTLPGIGDNVTVNHEVTIPSGSTVEVSSLYIASNGKLIVDGTLIIHGDFNMANNYPEIITGASASVIIYGSATLSNRVKIDLSSYFVVLGDFTRNGSNNQGEITVDDAHIYVMGLVDSGWIDFTGCDGTYDGTTTTEGDDCDAGSFQDLVEHVDPDDLPPGVYDDIVESSTSNANTLSSPTTELCSGGNIDLTISDGGAINTTWYKDDVVVESTGTTNPYNINSTGTYYSVYESGGDWYQTNDVVITNDITPPIVTVDSYTDVVSADGSCKGYAPNLIDIAVYSDNCTTPSSNWDVITQNPSSGSGLSAGTHQIILTATDNAGNSEDYYFDFEVIDDTDPGVTCQSGPVWVDPDSGECFHTVTTSSANDLDPSWYDDNCGSYILSNNITGTSSLVGQQFYENDEIVWTITDDALNSVQCTVVVNVGFWPGNTLSFTGCPSDINVNSSTGSPVSVTWTEPIANITGNGCISSVVNNYDPGDNFSVGTTTVTYTATDGDGNTVDCQFDIIVTDTSGSACPSGSSLIWQEDFTSPTGEWSIIGSSPQYSVVSNRMESNENENGAYWQSDPINTSAYYGIKISIDAGQFISGGDGMETADYIQFYYSIDGGSNFLDFDTNNRLEGAFGTASACTDVENAPSLIIRVLTHETANDEFHYFDNISVTGESDVTPPTAVCQDITAELDATGNVTISASTINNGSSDDLTAQGSLILSLDQTDFSCADLGANTVRLTVEDLAGNTSFCDATVTVEDNLAPVFSTSCLGNQSIESAGGYTHSGTSWDMAAADNCSSASVTYSLAGVTNGTGTSLNGVTFNTGATTVTWTATDGSNLDQCVFTVFITEPGVVPDPTYLSGYCTYKPITVTSTESLSNYQVELTISYDSQMNADFSDIRFSLENGTTLDYWIENYTASSTATVWVELPSLSIGKNYIYLFYGNSAATNQSDIDAAMNQGLLLEYYTYSGGGSPSESSWSLQSTCSDSSSPINYDWGSGNINLCGQAINSNVVLRWTGWLQKSGTGTNFSFRPGSDDGHRVNLAGGSIEMDDWNDQAYSTNTFSYNFSEDIISLQYDFYENGGDARATFEWDINGGSSYSIIPESNYHHATYSANPPSVSIGSEVDNEINLSFGSPSTNVCEDDTEVYTLTETYDSYSWSVSGGSITAGGGSGDNTVTITWGNGPTGSVSVDVISGGCSENLTHLVSVIPEPSFTAPTDETICVGETATLTVELDEESMVFDGNNDRIDIGNSGQINQMTVQNRTISLWFKANDVNTRQVVYEEGGGTHGISIFLEGGNVYVHAWESGSSYGAPSQSVSTGTWYHVTFVMDSGESNGDYIKGYLNGNYFGSATDSRASDGLPSHGGDVNIAMSDNIRFPDNSRHQPNYFNGYVDEFKLWNRSLTAEEIAAEMYNVNEGSGSGSNLIVYYNFNDDSGNTVTDETGGDNGTANGGATHDTDTPFTPTISWSPGGMTTLSVDVSPTETTTYTYTLTEPANGCETIGEVTVTVSNMDVGASSFTNETCPDENDGTINLEVTGGIGPYSFTWTTPDGNGLVETDEDQSGLSPGLYDVLIIDAHGCTETTGFTIEAAVDNTDPEITCTGDISVNVDAGTCGAVVNYSAPIGTDNCPGATTALIVGLGPGATFPVGITTETYEVTDSSGNRASCSFTVTVVGNEAPRLDCPPATVSLQADLNLCATTYDWESALNIDACNGYTLGWSRDDGVVLEAEKFNFTVGTTVVNVTVTDNSNGLQTTCQITVFVDENPDEDPAITAPDDVSVSCPAAVPAQLTLNYFETNSLVTDNCGYQNSSFSVSDATVDNPDGSQTITRTYSISDYAGNTNSDDQIITVTNDLEVNASITITPGCSVELLQITATSNGFTSPTYQWQRDEGSGFSDIVGANTLVLETSSHNEGDEFRLEVVEGSCTAYSTELTLIYNDQIAPVFDSSLDFNQTLCVPEGQTSGTVTGIGLTSGSQVSDNCTAFPNLVITYVVSGATTVNSPATGQNDAGSVSFNVGTSTVIYTVEDESGNGETYSFDVIVNNEPSIGSVSTDGSSGTDGSGYKPYQGSSHTYSVTDDAGFNYTWRVENSGGTNITGSLSPSGQGSANFTVTWNAAAMPGNYTVYVIKQSQSTNCESETSLSVTVLNSFNPKVQDFGDACHSVTGATTMDFVVHLEPGTRVAPEWYFDWALYLNGGGVPIQTGNITVIGQDSHTVSIAVVVGDGSEKNYRFLISNGADSLGNTDNNGADNEDFVKIFTQPTIGF